MYYLAVALVMALFLTVFVGYKASEIKEDNPLIIGLSILLISGLWPLAIAYIFITNLYALGSFLRKRDSGKISTKVKHR